MTESRKVIKREEDKPAPKRCPFYGFHATPPLLFAQGGNECPLATIVRKGLSPCLLELGGKFPAWETCGFFNTEDVKAILRRRLPALQVIHPDAPRSISFSEWQKSVGLEL